MSETLSPSEAAALRSELDALRTDFSDRMTSMQNDFALAAKDMEARLNERIAAEKRERESQLDAVRADVRTSLLAHTAAVEKVGERVANDLDSPKGLVP